MATILVWCWFISHLRKVWKNIFKIIPTCLTFDLSFLLSFRICNPLVTKNLSRPKTWERTFKNKLQICKERCEEGLSFFVAFYKNGPTPASFIVYFRSFQTTLLQILQQINVKKCPSSIWCRDSNPQPLEHESILITTRPRIPLTWLMFKPRSDLRKTR